MDLPCTYRVPAPKSVIGRRLLLNRSTFLRRRRGSHTSIPETRRKSVPAARVRTSLCAHGLGNGCVRAPAAMERLDLALDLDLGGEHDHALASACGRTRRPARCAAAGRRTRRLEAREPRPRRRAHQVPAQEERAVARRSMRRPRCRAPRSASLTSGVSMKPKRARTACTFGMQLLDPGARGAVVARPAQRSPDSGSRCARGTRGCARGCAAAPSARSRRCSPGTPPCRARASRPRAASAARSTARRAAAARAAVARGRRAR